MSVFKYQLFAVSFWLRADHIYIWFLFCSWYSHLSTHDFSDSMLTTTRQFIDFVADPRMGGDQVADWLQEAVSPSLSTTLRDVANQNPSAVFLESMLPWVNLGDKDVVLLFSTSPC